MASSTSQKTQPKKEILESKHSKRKEYLFFSLGVIIGIILTLLYLTITKSTKAKRSERIGVDLIKTESHPNKPFCWIFPNSKTKKDESESEKRLHKLLQMSIHDFETQNAGWKISVYYRNIIEGSEIVINPDEVYSPSSLMKVPIMIAVYKRAMIAPGFLNNSLIYQKSRVAKARGRDLTTSGERTSLVIGKAYTVDELVNEMIINSDNEATLLLLDVVEDAWVKQVEKEMGFSFPKGVKYYTNIITIGQYAQFFNHLIKASYLNKEMSEKALALLSKSDYPHGIRKVIPSETVVAHKYGRNSSPLTNEMDKVDQLHHFAVVYDNDKPFMLGIMVKGDEESRMVYVLEWITDMIYSHLP